MRQELEHFHIGDSYGGSQDWFPTFMMRMGGCAAETACDSSIYFAIHRRLLGIAPDNAAALSKKDYIRFAYEMKPYLSPRAGGVDRVETYIDGYAKYLRDRGETRLHMTPLPGTEPCAAAQEAITWQIDHGYPIPLLILRHRDKKYADYVWHWFLLNGYDDTADAFRVKAVTYGSYAWLDFGGLWNTGFGKRGGLVRYQGL
jgi:hypothetical protein